MKKNNTVRLCGDSANKALLTECYPLPRGSKFLPNLSTQLNPLHRLLVKNKKWFWGAEQDRAFQKAKEALRSNTLLVHFDPSKPIILACDASQYGIGAVLSHVERPIAYTSRTLNPAEKRYSQLEKEFSETKGIPQLASARIQRWALTLSTYNYTIRYKAGKSLGNADALSRLPRPVTIVDDCTPADLEHLVHHLSSTTICAIQERLSKFLFSYRITPHTVTGVSPAELLMGRRLHSRLDLLYPGISQKVQTQQSKQKQGHDNTRPLRSFKVGDISMQRTLQIRHRSGCQELLPKSQNPFHMKWSYNLAHQCVDMSIVCGAELYQNNLETPNKQHRYNYCLWFIIFEIVFMFDNNTLLKSEIHQLLFFRARAYIIGYFVDIISLISLDFTVNNRSGR